MLYQGDVFRDVPFPTWPTFKTETDSTKWGILRPLGQQEGSLQEWQRRLPKRLLGSAARDIPDLFKHSREESVIGLCQLTPAMIVSRSCSLDNPKRKQFLIAPVVTLDSLADSQKSPEMLEELRDGNIPHFFHLPSAGALPESYADFQRITHLHRTFFRVEDLPARRLVRLSSRGMNVLQHRLADHFGLQFGFSHEDICPQDGSYSCSTCFHLGHEVIRVLSRRGLPFGPCRTCGEGATFIKLPN
jgi:hypothetical protein